LIDTFVQVLMFIIVCVVQIPHKILVLLCFSGLIILVHMNLSFMSVVYLHILSCLMYWAWAQPVLITLVSGGGEKTKDGRELQTVASAATEACCTWRPRLRG